MALKAFYAAQTEIPEPLREHYVEKDGKWVLDTEGGEDVSGLKGALGKEREARASLERTLADLKKQLGDADPAKAREAVKKLQDLEDKKLIEEGKVEELLAARTKRMQDDYEAKLRETSDALAAREKQISELVIDNALRAVATTAKVRATAVDDFLERGRKVYRLKDGKAVPMNGDEIIFGKKGNEPMPMDEWAAGLTSAAPHLFEGSTGGGAAPSAGGAGKPYVLTAEQAKDRQMYLQAKDAAQKAGQELQIVG